jgi:hypothetical protein
LIHLDTRLKEVIEGRKGTGGETDIVGDMGRANGKGRGREIEIEDGRDLRLEAPSITSPQPFTSTSTPFFWLRSCKFPRRGYITSSLGLKITNGLSSIFPGISSLDSDVEGGRSVDNNSKSRASVLGYSDKSSVGANFHYLLHISCCIGKDILALDSQRGSLPSMDDLPDSS